MPTRPLQPLLAGFAMLLAMADGAAQTPGATTFESADGLETMVIVGDRQAADRTPGAAHVLSDEDLEKFRFTDIDRILRTLPGVNVQTEDGLGLRPNIGIRGTPTDRSSKISLMEDGVLIAPAPYAAPAAYYFPYAARMSAIEVLKGPAAITEGPNTVGGAVNLRSTPIPDEFTVALRGETGSFDTNTGHLVVGDSREHFGFMLEGLRMISDGFKDIDRSDTDTGYDIEDYVAKFRINNDRSAPWYHELTLKLQYSEETSDQTYLGLTDDAFDDDADRLYGLTRFDEMNTRHHQQMLTWRMRAPNGMQLAVTAYNNDHRRDWFKTEGIDLNGSADAQAFNRISWFDVVDSINRGEALADDSGAVVGVDRLNAILEGADTAEGAIQLRSNAREYYSRGIQAEGFADFTTGPASHALTAGVRYHEDEEDRLQRNDSYTQIDGRLELADRGILGNAGNRKEEAEALALWVRDRIEIGRWTLTPGLRLEDISLSRKRYFDVPTRDPEDLRDERDNDITVWLPGLGVLYRLDEGLSLLAGVHKGFSTPSSDPDTREEQSVNYELGFRYQRDGLGLDVVGFWNDYDNLLGLCTNSSGGDCEFGEVFEGDAVTARGIESTLTWRRSLLRDWQFVVDASYTFTDATFDTDIADTGFFGDVQDGDDLPYVPDHQAVATIGLEHPRYGVSLRTAFTDEMCVQGGCDRFLRTDDLLTFDLSGRFRAREGLEVFAVLENLTDQEEIVGRHPYGARGNKPRAFRIGFDFRL